MPTSINLSIDNSSGFCLSGKKYGSLSNLVKGDVWCQCNIQTGCYEKAFYNFYMLTVLASGPPSYLIADSN